MWSAIRDIYNRNQFQPGLLGLFVNPFYFARKGLFENISLLSKYISGRVLDVGCGQRPYEVLFKVTEYVGMDIEQSGHDHSNEKIDVFYDGKKFPFQENEFNAIVTFEVFEHVFNPEVFLAEIRRVLKKDGLMLMTVPFVWDEHEQPYDFARYSSFGLRHLLETNGFEIVEFRKSINDIRVIFQLINDYIYKKTCSLRKGFYSGLMLNVVLMAPFNIMGAFLNAVLPANNDLYLDNVVLARKVNA